MTGADTAIRWSTVAAVSLVALVAASVSYRHALQVVGQHGESGWLDKVYALTIDGLIYAASMVLLTAARQGIRTHWLAYGALSLGNRRNPGRQRGCRAGLRARRRARGSLASPGPW